MAGSLEDLSAQLGKLTDEGSRQAFLAINPQLLTPAVVEELAEAVRKQVRVNVPNALDLAEGAITIAANLQDLEASGRARRAKANVLWLMGQCKPAVELFREAAELFEGAGNLNELGRTLSTSIQSLALLGSYDEAFATAARARGIFRQLGDTWRLARVEVNVANIYHRLSRYADALKAYRDGYEQLLAHRDTEGIGVALHNVTVCLIALDDFRGALDTYSHALSFCDQHEMPLLAAQASYNIAYLFYLRGDYTQALDRLHIAREICRKNGDDYHLALCDLDQSEIYLDLSLIEEASAMARQSFEKFQKLAMPYEAARSLANQGIAAGLNGNPSESLNLLSQAKKMIASEKNQIWPSLLDLYRAITLFDQGSLEESAQLCEVVVGHFQTNPQPGKQVLAELLLARIAIRQNNLELAQLHCRAALDLLAQIDAPRLADQAHFVMGQIHEAFEDSGQAYAAYQDSRRALETLRRGVHGEELKIEFMKNKGEVYERLVHLCLQRDSKAATLEEAFLYVEEAKSRGFRDLMFGRAGLSPVAVPETSEADRKRKELREELNWFYHRIEREQLSAEGAPAEVIESLRARAKEHEQELLRLVREAPSDNSPLRRLLSSEALPLSEIRDSLRSRTALIEYFTIGNRLHAVVVTCDRLSFIPLALVSQIEDRILMLQFQMSKMKLGQHYNRQFHAQMLESTRRHLANLYKDILAPCLMDLTERHLVIVPHGSLHSLPFHALYDGECYLIDRFTVSYAPSASIYALGTRAEGNSSGPSLLLGIEDPAIPFVREEIRVVSSVVRDPVVRFGEEASIRALRDIGARSRIIHIATHGFFRKDSPMFSAIRLGDEYLNLYDLYHMSLPADLITLSACVTGLNVIVDGDEPLGLTRGLLFAGAQSVLLSMWDVDDQSTAQFMGLFYAGWMRGGNKAEALRDAIIELRARYPHPFHWAPFKLAGKAID